MARKHVCDWMLNFQQRGWFFNVGGVLGGVRRSSGRSSPPEGIFHGFNVTNVNLQRPAAPVDEEASLGTVVDGVASSGCCLADRSLMVASARRLLIRLGVRSPAGWGSNTCASRHAKVTGSWSSWR